MKQVLYLIGLFALAAATQTAGATDSVVPHAFDQLLLESGLQVETRDSYSEVPIEVNPVLSYEYAIKHASGALELRFIVRPLSRITIDYNDPHNAAPEPNHLFPLLFESMTNRLSVGSDTPSSTFPESEARKSFNAHWAAAAVFDVRPEFAAGYQNGLLIGMHRNELADAYTLFLYNDHEQARPLINEALSIMSFNPETQ